MFSASCCDYYDSYTVSFTSSESTMHVNCQRVHVMCVEMHLSQCYLQLYMPGSCSRNIGVKVLDSDHVIWAMQQYMSGV